MAMVDVLIPTYRRKTGLAMVLTSLLGQTARDFDVVVADQTPVAETYLDDVEIMTAVRALEWRGHRVELHRRGERHGMAEQRQFLLERSHAPYAHYLDDDVLLDPPVLERMLRVIRQEGCGFVGCAATGLDYLHDVRPHQQGIELWDGPVRPEPFAPDNLALVWDRHLVNNAANPLHLEQRLVTDPFAPQEAVRYKVAWVGGANVLYDRAKLLSVGGLEALAAGARRRGGGGAVPVGAGLRRLRHPAERHLPPWLTNQRGRPRPQRDRIVRGVDPRVRTSH